MVVLLSDIGAEMKAAATRLQIAVESTRNSSPGKVENAIEHGRIQNTQYSLTEYEYSLSSGKSRLSVRIGAPTLNSEYACCPNSLTLHDLSHN
jgi:hypothetical protein